MHRLILCLKYSYHPSQRLSLNYAMCLLHPGCEKYEPCSYEYPNQNVVASLAPNGLLDSLLLSWKSDEKVNPMGELLLYMFFHVQILTCFGIYPPDMPLSPLSFPELLGPSSQQIQVETVGQLEDVFR